MGALSQAQSLKELLQSNLAAAQRNSAVAETAKQAADSQATETAAALAELEKLIAILTPPVAPPAASPVDAPAPVSG